MTVKVISRKLDARDVFIKLVDGTTIRGKVNLYSDGHMIQRVSDIFTKVPDPFITVFDAAVEGEMGRCVIINKNNIVWVSPEECPVELPEVKLAAEEADQDNLKVIAPKPV